MDSKLFLKCFSAIKDKQAIRYWGIFLVSKVNNSTCNSVEETKVV